MKRAIVFVLASVFSLALAAAALAATEVKMSGDARIHGNYRTHYNFTPWNARGMNYFTGAPQAAIANVAPATGSEENFTIWERFRLKTDFIASESLKFRLGLRVNNASWGGSLAIDNPPVAVDVNMAYLQFLIPGTEAQVTAGYQPLALPQSKIFNGGLVLDTQLGNTSGAAVVLDIPVVKDTFAIKAGYTRLLDGAADFYANTTPVDNAVDAFFLALPVTLDGFQFIPWGALAFAGRAANYVIGSTTNIMNGVNGAYGPYDGGVAITMLSPVAALRYALGGQAAMWNNQNNAYYWFGLPMNITAADPINFYADVIYGAGAQGDSSWASRSGWFIDAGIEYVGLDMVKPQLMGWWSTGETGNLTDGSRRIPTIRSFWTAGASWLFAPSGSAYTRSSILANPVGSWGLSLSFKDITFAKGLTHTLTGAIANGTNSPSWMRSVNMLGLGGIYAIMGKDLTTEEWLYGVNLDTTYMIYENLSAIVELGWAGVSGLRGSVWGTRNVNNYGDAWKVAFGFRYTF
jgi:hypothetical protein